MNIGDNILDVRDMIERVEELEAERDSFHDDCPDITWAEDNPSDADELDALKSALKEMQGAGGDHEWQGDWYPVTLVREEYFEDFAKDEAWQLDLIKQDVRWPYNHIDWEAAATELQQDYSQVDVGSYTYFYRG